MAFTAEKFPTSSASNAVAGDKILLYVAYDSKWNHVGGSTDTGLTVSNESIDASCKDSDGWGDAIPGGSSWELSNEIIVKTGNTGDEIIEEWVFTKTLRDSVPKLKFAVVNTADNSYYEGFGVVNSWELSSSHGDVATKSISVTGAGAIVKKEGFSAETLA